MAVLYFGSVENEGTTYPRLRNAIRDVFAGGLKLNDEYKRTGSWPTLGKAVKDNKRVFVFARTDLVESNDREVVKEVQVEVGKTTASGACGLI